MTDFSAPGSRRYSISKRNNLIVVFKILPKCACFPPDQICLYGCPSGCSPPFVFTQVFSSFLWTEISTRMHRVCCCCVEFFLLFAVGADNSYKNAVPFIIVLAAFVSSHSLSCDCRNALLFPLRADKKCARLFSFFLQRYVSWIANRLVCFHTNWNRN